MFVLQVAMVRWRRILDVPVLYLTTLAFISRRLPSRQVFSSSTLHRCLSSQRHCLCLRRLQAPSFHVATSVHPEDPWRAGPSPRRRWSSDFVDLASCTPRCSSSPPSMTRQLRPESACPWPRQLPWLRPASRSFLTVRRLQRPLLRLQRVGCCCRRHTVAPSRLFVTQQAPQQPWPVWHHPCIMVTTNRRSERGQQPRFTIYRASRSVGFVVMLNVVLLVFAFTCR